MIGCADGTVVLRRELLSEEDFTCGFDPCDDSTFNTMDAMSKSVRSLFKGIKVKEFHGELDSEISCIITDSRRVIPGALFFAIGGLRTDGNFYIKEAIDRGASAIVTELPYSPSYVNATHIHVENAREVLANVSAKFYRHPDRNIQLSGITGTNGKTTVAALAQFLLEEEAGEVGLLGTIHYDIGSRTLPAYKTTPESVDIYSMLSQMHENGCRHCTMEVSSHAIDQFRVEGLSIRIAAFLNISQDHLDYHKSMEGYFQVKAKLFTGETGNVPEVALVNIDDHYGRRLLEYVSPKSRLITCSMEGEADICAKDIKYYPEHSEFRIVWPEGEGVVSCGLPGRYNVSNVLMAMAIVYASGMDLEAVLPKLKTFPGVPGRMEKVTAGQDFQVMVDYAHTDDALKNALGMLKEITKGRLFVVFGCGGNRDREKRSKMVEAVQSFADYAWATADNPRNEPLESIFEDMKKGVTCADDISFVEDRRRAISLALDYASPGDCVLVAGKGHETFQEFSDTVVPFDDRNVIRELIELKSFRQIHNDETDTITD